LEFGFRLGNPYVRSEQCFSEHEVYGVVEKFVDETFPPLGGRLPWRFSENFTFKQEVFQFPEKILGQYVLYTETEKNASMATSRSEGVTEGNASGIAYIQANPGKYTLYTETERNASVATARSEALAEGNATGVAYVQSELQTKGLSLITFVDKVKEDEKNALLAAARPEVLAEGNATDIAYVQSNPSLYTLYTESDRNASVATAREAGVTEGLATGLAEAAVGGLSLQAYLDKVSAKPHTHDWYYQPDVGWLWTNESTFPFVYKAGTEDADGAWVYFSQLTGEPVSYYDYSQEKWVTIAE
jgi:hypothetical protein